MGPDNVRRFPDELGYPTGIVDVMLVDVVRSSMS
jgi:hypothetical protein